MMLEATTVPPVPKAGKIESQIRQPISSPAGKGAFSKPETFNSPIEFATPELTTA
jgi:hypothetical protein